jgi:signal transduction histidine kinase
MFGIRGRATLIAVVVVGVALATAIFALVVATEASVREGIAANAVTRAQDVAQLATDGTLAAVIPGRGEALLVQVFDASGTVIAASGSIEGQEPIVDTTLLGPGVMHTRTVNVLTGDTGAVDIGETDGDNGGPYIVVGLGASSLAGRRTVMVVASLAPAKQVVSALRLPLVIGFPALLLTVAVTVWLLTGRALRPVEAIRAEADEVSGTELHRRLPVPESADEIQRLAVTMNRMLDRLESSASRQREFVADASHELKSPIAAIRTMLEIAQNEPQTVDLGLLLADLSAEDRRLERLTNDLLTLAQWDERAADAALTDVDLDDVVLREMTAVCSVTDKAIDVECIRPVRMHANPERMAQLVRNLLDNAVRHAVRRVWVGLDAAGPEARLTVSDDGPGIAPEDRERVFERFVRLDDGRSRGDGGTGLGLAVVRAIARSHGGDVRVVEPAHGGATFEVCIPLESGT